MSLRLLDSYMEGSSPPEWVGKSVRDVYGRNLGRAIGMVFDVGGKLKSVGVKAGDALMTILPEQVTSDEDELLVIPQWKLESRHVGLEGGVLMKRVSALNRMVDEKRISRELSDELFAKLNGLQKSHDIVIARILSRMGDLARANRAVDEFVSLVTLQYFAGEMSQEKFDLTAKECGGIKAMNNQEILDMKLALGMEATGEEPDANLLDELARELGVNKNPEKESSPPVEDPSWAGASANSYPDLVRPQLEAQIPEKGNGPGSRDDADASMGYGRQRPAIRELEDAPLPQAVPQIVLPEREMKPKSETGRPAQTASPLASPMEGASPASAQAQVLMSDLPAIEKSSSTSVAQGESEPLLDRQVSEWIFAKIVDLEALDIRPGDYRPLKSLEKK